MANLIIAVIAIGLAAATAVMGIYYGGSYFMNAQPRADASTLLIEGVQVANAFKSYTRDHGYNGTNPVVPASWAQMINGGYLTAIPQAPPLTTNYAGTNIALVGTGKTYWLWVDLGLATADNSGPNAAVCLSILTNALGTLSPPIVTTGVNNAELTGGPSTGTGNGTYGCVLDNVGDNDPGASSVMPDNQGLIPTGDYAFFYRLY